MQSTTWVHLGGAVDQEAWVTGDRFSMNHAVSFNGELKKAEVYPLLKTLKIDQFELDLTQATDA